MINNGVKEQKILFSIITVTLNNINGLKKTYNSIKEQSHHDFEWLIIDGGSDDGSHEYLDSINVHYLSEKDKGIYDAMNKGIKRASGQYYIFMNAGDAFEANHTLGELFKRLEGKPCDFIYGDAAEDIDGKIYFKRARPHYKINQGMFTHHQAMIYNQSLFQSLKYNQDFEIAADYDLTWRALNKAKNILYVPFPICLFEAGGISQKRTLQGRIEQYKIRKNHGVVLYKRLWIFIKQSAVYALRLIAPRLYWLLKSR